MQLVYIESVLNSSEDCTVIGEIIEDLYAKYQTSELLLIKLQVTILYTWYRYKQRGPNCVVELLHDIIALVNRTGYARFVLDYPIIHTLLYTHSIQSDILSIQSQQNKELTHAEQQILQLLAHNLTYTEIAKSLYISVNTVRFHLKNIYRKLGSNRRGKVIAIALKNNLIN